MTPPIPNFCFNNVSFFSNALFSVRHRKNHMFQNFVFLFWIYFCIIPNFSLPSHMLRIINCHILDNSDRLKTREVSCLDLSLLRCYTVFGHVVTYVWNHPVTFFSLVCKLKDWFPFERSRHGPSKLWATFAQ